MGEAFDFFDKVVARFLFVLSSTLFCGLLRQRCLLCFLFCCMTMGLSRWFFVEAKSFEFALEKGISVLRFFERSRGFMRSISIGRVIVHWLLATMERLLEAEESM